MGLGDKHAIFAWHLEVRFATTLDLKRCINNISQGEICAIPDVLRCSFDDPTPPAGRRRKSPFGAVNMQFSLGTLRLGSLWVEFPKCEAKGCTTAKISSDKLEH